VGVTQHERIGMSYTDYFNNTPEYTYRRTALRHNQTKAEKVLWCELRSKRLGVRFRRQFQIGRYIVDFYCHELRLIVELDGPIHEHQTVADSKREAHLTQVGNHVVRYLNDEVLFDRDSVMRHLTNLIEQRRYTLER